MVAFDNTKQKMPHIPPVRMEVGDRVTIVVGSGQAFTIATKMKKVLGGFGVMDTDGMIAIATPGAPSNGQVTFTRFAPIVTSADTITYTLFGK